MCKDLGNRECLQQMKCKLCHPWMAFDYPDIHWIPMDLMVVIFRVGLDKICSVKFEQNGQPEERSNFPSKIGCQFAQKKSKMGKE